MDTVFTANALSKHYGKARALDGLSMRIPAGSVYGFVGRNGAGKTTLIRLLCGLQQPTGGEYTLFGVSGAQHGIAAARRRIGAMAEAPALYQSMTAEENIAQQRRLLGLPQAPDASELLTLVGLEKNGRKKVKHFSQGMRQKLGIAVAMTGGPDFLVLDEPTNGLDPQGLIELRALIAKLNRERGVTFLISSHILSELSRLATHYGFIDKGRMVKEITAAELESAFQRTTRVEVSDTRALATALERRNIKYRIISDCEADILAKISLTALAVDLIKDGCEIYSCREQNENLEDYFIHLVGGGQDA